MRKLPPSGGCGGKQCNDRCKVQEASFRYLPWSSLVLGCVHSHRVVDSHRLHGMLPKHRSGHFFE